MNRFLLYPNSGHNDLQAYIHGANGGLWAWSLEHRAFISVGELTAAQVTAVQRLRGTHIIVPLTRVVNSLA